MCVNFFGPDRLPIYVYICPFSGNIHMPYIRYSKWMFGYCHFSVVYIGDVIQMQVLLL